MNIENTPSKTEKKKYGHTVRISLGVVFVILGIIGSFLPVLQGWLFFLIAFVLLFPEHPKVVKIARKIEEKHPKTRGWFRAFGVGEHSEKHQNDEKPEESAKA